MKVVSYPDPSTSQLQMDDITATLELHVYMTYLGLGTRLMKGVLNRRVCTIQGHRLGQPGQQW